MKNVIILDNNPDAYSWNKDNGVPILSWYSDLADTQLWKYIPILKKLATVDDVREFIPRFVENDRVNRAKALQILNSNPNDDNSSGILDKILNFKKGARNFFSHSKERLTKKPRDTSKDQFSYLNESRSKERSTVFNIIEENSKLSISSSNFD